MRTLVHLFLSGLLSLLSGCIIYPTIDSESPPGYRILNSDSSRPDFALDFIYLDFIYETVCWREKCTDLKNTRLETDYWIRHAENTTNLTITSTNRRPTPPLDSEYWYQRSVQQLFSGEHTKFNGAKLKDGNNRELCQWQLTSNPKITKQLLGTIDLWCSKVSPVEREIAYDKAHLWREEWLRAPSKIDVCVASLRSQSRAEISRGLAQQSAFSACGKLSLEEWYSAVKQVEPMLSRWDRDKYPLVSAP